MTVLRCPECDDNGTILNLEDGTWDVCACEAGDALAAELKQGIEDMEAGRTHPFKEIRRS